jgi:hypothetical protein
VAADQECFFGGGNSHVRPRLRVKAAKISDVRNEHYRQHISRDNDADPKRKAAIISPRHDRRAEVGVDHDPRRLRVVNNISDQSSR